MEPGLIEYCFIVASGPSAEGFVPPVGMPVIAVNGVIDWIRRADYWITIDGSSKNLRHLIRRRPETWYFAALPEKYALPAHVTRLRRDSSGCQPGLSTMPYTINSGNSAFAALGLAYHLGVKRVALIGVDGTTERRVEGGYSGQLNHLPELFESAIGQISMVNCGKLQASKIPKMSKHEAYKWLKQ